MEKLDTVAISEDTVIQNVAVLNRNSEINKQDEGKPEACDSNGKSNAKSTSTSNTLVENQGSTQRKSLRKRKAGPQELGNNYTLRSSTGDVRVLRSMTKEDRGPTPSTTSAEPVTKRRKKTATTKKSEKDEFSSIKQRIRYILGRMGYEQSLIQAYASEGWNRQSVEKVRLEKEIERAKNEILRCKLIIRDKCRQLESMLSEGRLEESLFDAQGEISSEDIYCSKCGSKDIATNNDIILCDGLCDRGFHQKCLNPPLRTEEIPQGDEEWLCPACNCKIDCIILINEIQGCNLSIKDSWEKVFPEAADGNKNHDSSGLPFDDSEDDDFDPNASERRAGDDNKDSGSDNSDDASEDAGTSKNRKQDDYLGLPSEDSEDDDFDPEAPVSDNDEEEDNNDEPLGSDESDFTSDSDEFCAEIARTSGMGEVSSYDHVEETTDTDGLQAAGSEVLPLDGEEMDEPVHGKRRVERLDYKKLYDEAYGNVQTDSSDDDEWSGKDVLDEDQHARVSVRAKSNNVKDENSSRAKRRTQADAEGAEVDHASGNQSSRKHHFGPVINKRLREVYDVDPYPNRPVKEGLAEELGLTYTQVHKWFASTRHYKKVTATKSRRPEISGPSSTKTAIPENAATPPTVAQISADATVGAASDDIEPCIILACTTLDSSNASARRITAYGTHVTNSGPMAAPTALQGAPCSPVVAVDNARKANSNSIIAKAPPVPATTVPEEGPPRGSTAAAATSPGEPVDDARRKAILRELRRTRPKAVSR